MVLAIGCWPPGRQDAGTATGAQAAALVSTAASQFEIYNWTFLLGQSLMPAINARLLGSLLYRSRLVPRVLPVLGLIGAPCSSPPTSSSQPKWPVALRRSPAAASPSMPPR
jgi:hypothetical protein